MAGRIDVVGIGALNVDYIASASRLSQQNADRVSESAARFEWNTEGPVDRVTVAKAIERLGSASLETSLGGSAWLTVYSLAQLRTELTLGYVGVAGRIEAPGLSFLGQMDQLGVDRRFVARRPDLPSGVCLSYLEDLERVLLTHPGANFAMAEHLRAHGPAVAEYLAAARLVHVTSFLDPDTPGILLEVLQEAKRRSPALEISLDPGFDWAQHPSGTMEGLLRLTDLLFVNHRELKALAAYLVGESDEVLAARVLRRCAPGATMFVTKRYDAAEVFRIGTAGLLARRYQLQRPVREGAIEDATGAGDVFAASVLATRTSQRLQVELGARIGLGLSRQRTLRGRGYGPTLPLLDDAADAGTGGRRRDSTVRPAAVLLAHEEGPGWQELERFLAQECGLAVHAVDLSRRPAGGSPVTGELLARCSFAVCVLTATRTMVGGERRAGERVVHQVGLLQGSYGFGRVAILAEEGCQAPSNIAGLVRLDFPSGRINSRFWELERLLEREGLLHG